MLFHLARKAFWPARLAFPVMQVDTGHNFPEVIEYRDASIIELDADLIVASVQESIDRQGRGGDGPRASRNRLQSVTLLDALEEHGFKAAFGGARRDEDRARAKERIFSFRNEFGQWDPKAQRPRCGTSTTASSSRASRCACFHSRIGLSSMSGSTYVGSNQMPSIYFAHSREVFRRDGMLYAVSPFVELCESSGRSKSRCAFAPSAT